MKRQTGRQRTKNLTPAQKGEVSQIVNTKMRRAGEEKFSGIGSGGTVPNSASMTFVSLTDNAQGTTDTAHIGDKVTISRLHLKYFVERNSSSATNVDYVRVVVFQWLPLSASLAPTVANLFLTDPLAGAINFRSMWSVDTTSMYRILYDKLHVLSGLGTSTSANESSVVYVDKWISLAKAKKEIQFYAASTTNMQGAIYFGILGLTTSNSCSYALASQFFFRDV